MATSLQFRNKVFAVPTKPAQPTLPFASDAIEWWDSPSSYLTCGTGGSVNNWIGRLNGTNLIASGNISPSNQPTVYNIEGTNYLHFQTSYMQIPNSVKWDRQNSSVFIAAMPGQSSNSRNIWFMGTNSPTDATYLNSQELDLFNAGNNKTSIFAGQNISIIERNSSGSSNVIMAMNAQQVSVPANDPGMVTGGWLGAGNGLNNLLEFCDILGVAVYNRTLTGSEPNTVFDFMSNYYKATPRTDSKNTVFCGDSITFGIGSTNPDYYSYPAQLARMPSHQPKYENSSFGGSVINSGAVNYVGTTGTNAYLSYNENASVNTVVMLIGSNDINNSVPFATITGSYYFWITGIRNVHPTAKIVGCTVLNRQGWDATQLSVQTGLNNWVMLTGNFDYTVNTQAIPQLADPNNTAIFFDGAHLTNLGYFYLAQGVYSSLITGGAISP